MKILKSIVVVLIVGLFLAVGSTIAISGEAPVTITIKDPAFGTFKKPPVPFSHERHVKEMNIACTECHHKHQEGKAIKKCSECHKVNAAEKNSLSFCKKTYPAGKAPGLKCALHLNCIVCHKAEKKKGKRPPTSCSKCHCKK